jgi:hypothetical protein
MILILEPIVKFIAISYVIFALIILVCFIVPHYEEYKVLRYIMDIANLYMSILLICSIGLTAAILVYIIGIT